MRANSARRSLASDVTVAAGIRSEVFLPSSTDARIPPPNISHCDRKTRQSWTTASLTTITCGAIIGSSVANFKTLKFSTWKVSQNMAELGRVATEKPLTCLFRQVLYQTQKTTFHVEPRVWRELFRDRFYALDDSGYTEVVVTLKIKFRVMTLLSMHT